MSVLEHLLEAWSSALLRGMLGGALFALVVFAVCRALPRLPAWLRGFLWWLAALKLLVAATGALPIGVPLLPAPAPGSPRVVTAHAAAPRVANQPGLLLPWRATDEDAGTASMRAPGLVAPGLAALAALWFAGALRRAGALASRYARHRRLLRRARPLVDPMIEAELSHLAARLGVRAPRLYTVAETHAPFVTGTWNTKLVFPSRLLRSLSPAARRMALAHELAHVRRLDLWLGWVPAVASLVFWFFPAAWIAAREYAQAREEACDASALAATGRDVGGYARLLLAIGIAPKGTALPAMCAASPHYRHLERRLLMLESTATWKGRPLVLATIVTGALALAGMLSLQVVAADAKPVKPATAAVPTVHPAQPGTPACTAPASPALPALAPGQVAPTAPPAPPPPPPAVAPVPPPPSPPAPAGHMVHGHGRNGLNWAYVDGDSSSMSGSFDDGMDSFRGLKKTYGDHFLYFRKNGQGYVVRDPALLGQLRAAFEPQQRLGREQGKLGEQQGALGAKQGELGRQQGELGAKQGELGAKQGELGAKHAMLAARLAANPDDKDAEKELDRLEAELDQQEQELDKATEPLERQQEELGRQQEELGRQQDELGRQQEALGRQQEKLAAEAERTLDRIIADALARGLAEKTDK